MKKDFSTIREMANKKLLNGEQKKTLHKLFESKIDTAIINEKQRHNKIEDKANKDFLEKIAKTKIVKDCMAMLLLADTNILKAEKNLSNLGLNFNENYQNKNRTLKTESYNEQPKELKTLREKNNEKIAKIEELKLKLLADLTGLPMTYSEMTEYINNEIEKF